jgi:hypothetical protein
MCSFFQQCPVVETTQSFRLCSACQEAYYCSKECQQQDWKSGRHRVECKKLRQDRASKTISAVVCNKNKYCSTDGIASPISPRDCVFLIHIANQIMKQNYDKIIQLRDQLLLIDPFTKYSFVIMLDHSVAPPTISVISARDYNHARDPTPKHPTPIHPTPIHPTPIHPTPIHPTPRHSIPRQ